MPEGRINPNGGAVALGRPLGATGARLTATLLGDHVRGWRPRGRRNSGALVTLSRRAMSMPVRMPAVDSRRDCRQPSAPQYSALAPRPRRADFPVPTKTVPDRIASPADRPSDRKSVV